MALSPAGREVTLTILRGGHTGPEVSAEERAELQPYQRSAIEKREEQRSALAKEVENCGATTEQLHADYLAALNAETARRARYTAALQTAAELPQLFTPPDRSTVARAVSKG